MVIGLKTISYTIEIHIRCGYMYFGSKLPSIQSPLLRMPGNLYIFAIFRYLCYLSNPYKFIIFHSRQKAIYTS